MVDLDGGELMQVNVFITRLNRQLLVLPYGPQTAVPLHLRHLRWYDLATTRTDDRLLARSASQIEADIKAQGFAVVTPSTADRR